MNWLRKLCRLCWFLLAATVLCAAQTPSDSVLTTMQQELNRSFQNLKKARTPPYFLSYQLTDNRAIEISAAFGALTGSLDRKTRFLDLDLRVGDHTMDNTRAVRDANPFGGLGDEFDRQEKIPLENAPDALRVALWQQTERKYRSAVQRLEQVKANVQVMVAAEDTSGDFSSENAETYFEPQRPSPLTPPTGSRGYASSRCPSLSTRRSSRTVPR